MIENGFQQQQECTNHWCRSPGGPYFVQQCLDISGTSVCSFLHNT